MGTYEVTITPKFSAHAGSWSAGKYTVEVYAKDRATAIKRARSGYEDAKVNPATFTAKLKRGEA
jgi:hypothetical protein